MVRAAMAFALQKLGRNYVPRLVDFMTSDKVAPQVADYLIELGPSIAPTLLSHLQDPSPRSAPTWREVLGALGDAGGGIGAAAASPRTRIASVAQAATAHRCSKLNDVATR